MEEQADEANVLYRPRDAAARLGVCVKTLRRWEREGHIKAVRSGSSKTAHRRYDLSTYTGRGRPTDGEADHGESAPQPAEEAVVRVREERKLRVGYCRVSSHHQRDDLARQSTELRSLQPPLDELIEDVGSGLNYKRRGFCRLIARIIAREIGEVVVAYRDRLCRFGFELVQQIATVSKCRITVLHQDVTVTSEQELAADLMDIVHVFSCRRNGKRRYRAISSSKDDSEDSEGSQGGQA